MKRREQNDRKLTSDRLQLNERWDAPHVDGERFIEEYIKFLSRGLETHGGLRKDVVSQFVEDEAEQEIQRFFGGVDEENWEAWENADYEPITSLDEDVLRFKDLAAEVKGALKDRDVEHLMESLYELLDMRGLLGTEPLWETGSVENWARQLDIRPTQPEEDASERSILEKAKVIVHRMCVELCILIARNPVVLQQIEWRQLEYILATALDEIGFNVELTPPSKDGGKDLVATCKIRDRDLVFYVEIKHWRSSKRVASRQIWDFIEVNMIDHTDGGLFISSSGYVPSIYSQLSEIKRRRIQLGMSDKVVTLCQHFVRKKQGIWYPVDNLPKVLFEGVI